MRCVVAGVALALSNPLLAGAQTARLPTSLELGYSRESLSNDSPDWQDTGIDISHRFNAREYLGVSLHDVKRFGVEDVSAAAFYLRPLTERVAASIEGGTDGLAGDRRRKGASLVPFHDALHGGSR